MLKIHLIPANWVLVHRNSKTEKTKSREYGNVNVWIRGDHRKTRYISVGRLYRFSFSAYHSHRLDVLQPNGTGQITQNTRKNQWAERSWVVPVVPFCIWTIVVRVRDTKHWIKMCHLFDLKNRIHLNMLGLSAFACACKIAYFFSSRKPYFFLICCRFRWFGVYFMVVVAGLPMNRYHCRQFSVIIAQIHN